MGKDEGRGIRSKLKRNGSHRANHACGDHASRTAREPAPLLCPSSPQPLFLDAVRREWETRLDRREDHSWY